MKWVPIVLAASLAGTAVPALAASETLALSPSPATSASNSLPRQLTPTERDGYRAVFAAIRAGDWSAATARLDSMAEGSLHPIARAELYLAKGSPKVELNQLLALIEKAPELPQASRLAALAKARGAEALPELPVARDLVRMPGAPQRQSARTTRSDAAAAALAIEITPLVKGDRPSDAEALLNARLYELTDEARTEWEQRVAWSYYLAGDDVSARRLATQAHGGTGEWTVQADWVAGLAAWRQHDCAAAADAFSWVAARARDSEMTAAGLFWAARADMACGRPDKVQARLRTASRLPETFYGLLAGGALGLAPPAPDKRPELAATDWPLLSQRPNIRAAAALAEIGENALADMLLKHQARIGAMQDHEALLHLAARLNLPATQIWLARNGPAGMRMSASARYPSPGWTPQGGWRIDKALIYAHALQESQFRTDAVSPAGARGLMQLMPGTAQLIAKKRGEPIDQSALAEPSLNFEYGQSYLQQLADFSCTAGLLPKVIAAYNAGPASIANWNARGRNLSDPLLFIESIPFVETRAYVAIVLRNYWMYQRQSGAKAESLRAMAQGMWPRFPGLPGKTAVRLDSLGQTASAE
jgi:soluble lytic murein transglycosylase-like protein